MSQLNESSPLSSRDQRARAREERAKVSGDSDGSGSVEGKVALKGSGSTSGDVEPRHFHV